MNKIFVTLMNSTILSNIQLIPQNNFTHQNEIIVFFDITLQDVHSSLICINYSYMKYIRNFIYRQRLHL